MYTLPGKEVVTATRTDMHGKVLDDTSLVNKLYVTKTRSSGDDFQAQYGGAFLDKLQKLYPEIFKEVMEDSGKTIDPSVKIKQRKAKYFNGTTIQNVALTTFSVMVNCTSTLIIRYLLTSSFDW